MRVERGYLDSGVAAVVAALDRGGVLVLGPAGAGRTTLLTDLAETEARGSRRVLWCRGRRHGRPSGDVGAAQGRPAQLLDLVSATPTTLLVDDAHLLDDELLDALAFVAERRDDVGLRVVVARRPVRAKAALAALDAALAGPEGVYHLAPLRHTALAGWAKEQGAVDPERLGHELAEQTGGWPDLVAATLAGRDGGYDAVRDLVRTRLAVLDPDQQRALCSIAFGLAPGSGPLRAATGLDHDAIGAAVEAATGEGLLHDTAIPVPAIARALRAETGVAARAAVAVAARTAPTDVMLAVAGDLATLDDCSPEAGDLFEAAARELWRREPRVALDLYDRAIAAGRPAASLHAARAEAALAAGQPERALAITHEAARAEDPTDRARVLMATGAAWAHLGRPELASASFLAAVDAHTSSREAGPAAALAVVAQAASGGLAPRPATIDAAHLPAESVGLMADAALAWMAGDAARTLSALQRSAYVAEAVGGVETWPDSPHAIGALVATHELDAAAAGRIVASATERAIGGAAFAVRHRLLAAWGTLRSGRVDDARAALDTTAAQSPRDQLVEAALHAAVALRVGSPDDLIAAQQRAVEARGRADLDLFSVDLAVELAHLAARTGADAEAVLAPLELAAATASGLPFLAVALAWARLLIASLAEDAEAAAVAAAAMATCTDRCGPARVLAPAAAAFAHVLAGAVDADEVRSAAALLSQHGLVFEASRLAGAAGLRCRDPELARQLLSESRRLRGAGRATAARRVGAIEALSEREREVARAVLEGRSHREIGQVLFISAKTVEHHVARIRQKVGAKTRAELLAAIRAELAPTV